MEPKGYQHLYTIRYTLKKSEIDVFLQELEEMRDNMIEDAVELSNYVQANEIIAHIKSL